MKRTKASLAALLAVTAAAGCRPKAPDAASLKDDTVGVATGACLAALPKLKQYDWHEDAGKESLTQVFETCLAELIRLETVNPPGNEHVTSAFYAKIFEALAIPHRIVQLGAPGDLPGVAPRSNVIAGWPKLREDAGEAGRGIVLMNHMDVVHVHADQWRGVPGIDGAPFSGATTEFDGERVVYGRGAIDMKNIGLMQALTLALLKQSGPDLGVPVYFVATADEEGGAAGVRALLAEAKAGGKAPELLKPHVVLNEGGFGIRGALGTASIFHAIGAEERGGAWLELTGSSLPELMKALDALSLAPAVADAGQDRAAATAALAGAKCKVEKVTTPAAKANVVPSKVVVRLACDREVSDQALAKVFDSRTLWAALTKAKSFEEFKPAELSVTRDALVHEVTIATATAGHGSSFAGLSALDHLAWGLAMLGAAPLAAPRAPAKVFRYQLTPASKQLLSTAAKHHDLLGGIVPAVDNIDKYLDKLPLLLGTKTFRALATRVGIDKLFRTACTWTGLEVAGSAATAVVDCRLIDLEPVADGGPSHPEKFVAEARSLFAKAGATGVSARIMTGWNFTASPIDSPLYRAIAETLQKQYAGSISTPFMIPGGTDSAYTRAVGVPSYGVTPAVVTVDVVSTFHGSDERFPVSQMTPATRAYVRMTAALAKAVKPQ